MKNDPVTSSWFRSFSSRKKLFPMGAALILVVAGLFGCLAIYSSRTLSDQPLFFVFKQMLWLFPGIAVFLAAAAVPFRFYRRVAPWWFLLSVISLIAVYLFGHEINHMRGWFSLGHVHFQPSEFAKCSLLLYLCVYCGARKELSFLRLAYLFLVSFGSMILIMLEPDFGGALMFFVAFILVIFLRGVRFHYILAAFGFLAVSAAVFILFNEYALMRILGYLNPDGIFSASAWHIKQFQYTMAHGGWTGSDWGNALWSGAFLPYPHTDSLFASIVESTGFAGGLIVIAGFVAMGIGFCVLSWDIRSGDDTRRFYVFSAGALYLIQALIHIGVNSVLLPPTGVTLPILSYGGSSLFSVMLAFGIAFSAANAKE
ncbi:MAG: Lipid II flippase FtsW [Lentisphaerae bacterium ADurb.Bin242]|nr:MAG: Lipid II flippase FtsW [Lentisphaerae bacterium ADurb.Bin242]